MRIHFQAGFGTRAFHFARVRINSVRHRFIICCIANKARLHNAESGDPVMFDVKKIRRACAKPAARRGGSVKIEPRNGIITAT
jgi:hypothetical protein